jgi:Family of unknown function (DUF5694)
MTRSLLILLACTFNFAANAAEKPIQMMVLGTYHFESPGLDVNNIKVDSVLTPMRQAQLDAVARALLAFRPTHVMVEMQSNEPMAEIKQFREFQMEKLTIDSNEIVQLGFRIAKLGGLSVVNGIDVQPSPGEQSYFPYDTVQQTATKLNQTEILTTANAPVAAVAKKFETQQRTATVAQLLVLANSKETLRTVNNPYFAYLSVGDGNIQPGAELNARWYLRNAKIFGRIVQIAKPGDRLLIVYGFGHNYWLRHFATETPGYIFVDPTPFLKKARPK